MSEVRPDRRALYLRWRPGRFADVLGQEHVTRTLRNAVATGQVAHAYLFCGPRGTGKTSIARILFKALACEAPRAGDACDACGPCRAVATGQALDLVEIDAASNRGIDHIRDLREKVWIAPSQAPRKMYILDEAHQLSGPAWDAFLKTLEEPPPHVVFVLATTEVHKVPATILSRCQRFDLGRIALADLVAHLQKVVAAEGLDAEPAVLQRIARLSRGGVRDALSTLDQLVAYAGDRLTLAAAREVLGLTAEESLRATAEALARHDARAALDVVGELAREGADLRRFLDDLVGYLRALLLARLGASEALAFEFGADEQAWLESQAGAWQPTQLVALVRRLSAVDVRGRDAGQLQVQLELALLEAALGDSSTGAPVLAGGAGAVVSPPRLAEPARPAPPHVMREVAPPDASTAAPVPPPAVPAADGVPGGAEPPAAPAAGSDAAPDLAALRHRWPHFVEAVYTRLPKAGIALETATVVGYQGQDLLVAFTNPFLQSTIEEDADCRRVVEELLAQELGLVCRVRCVAAAVHQPALLEDAFLQRAVELFGATGVERVDVAPSAGEEQPS